MDGVNGYTVDLKGMQGDTASYRWQAADDFFAAVQGPEIKRGQLDVALLAKRACGGYELEFQLQGEVEVTCDRCLEPMPLPIDTECLLRVKLGEEYADDGDVVTIPEREGIINVAWNIYEFAALQIPLRHVHPEGQCKGTASLQIPQEGVCDPRWDNLKKIKAP